MRVALQLVWFCMSVAISINIMTWFTQNWEEVVKNFSDIGFSAWHVAGMGLI
jgi:hypothetical protein